MAGEIRGCHVKCPIQPNGIDCGLFLLETAEYIFRNYSQILWEYENGAVIDASTWYEPLVAVRRRSVLREEIKRASREAVAAADDAMEGSGDSEAIISPDMFE